MERKIITIAISTAFQDAGDATRALEIAKGLKKYQPANIDAKIVFLSHGSKFEKRAIDLGCEIYKVEPALPGAGLYQDLGMTPLNFVGTKELAKEMILGEIEAYKKLKPDVVLHGFWPMAGLARRMVDKEIPGIAFLPLPLVDSFFDILPDVPDQVKILAMLPYKVRMWMFCQIPKFIKRRLPLIRQNNIRQAVKEIGWKGEPLENTFDILKPNLMIVNDLPEYYDKSKFLKDVVFTGTLFATTENNEPIDEEILKIFNLQNNRPKIFCTLSSSGSEEMLKEVIKIFTYGEGLGWNAVILSPHFELDKAKQILGDRSGVYITDKFIPAQRVNVLADIVICHGGQGTVQTAVYSGTPIVGFAAQQEQFLNLANIAQKGAGIRIAKQKWNSKNIQNAVSKILADEKYKNAMLKLREKINATDGQKNAAEAIWKKIIK